MLLGAQGLLLLLDFRRKYYEIDVNVLNGAVVNGAKLLSSS